MGFLLLIIPKKLLILAFPKHYTSLLQRRLGLGYGRAAKLIDRMQAEGIVSPPDGSKPRTVLITADEFLERFANDEFGSGEDTEE